MLIEIRETGFINKGAELMLRAMISKLRENLPDAELVMAAKPNDVSFKKRAELGLYQKVWLQHYGIQWGCLGCLIPQRIRKMYGLILDSEINAVLDASGFSYGDQWGHFNCVVTAKAAKKWKKRGAKLIFMPQAFGPFTNDKLSRSFESLVENADLIYTRDKLSHEYVTNLVGARSKIKIAPDFTNLIEGELPPGFDSDNNRFCIIPNHLMIEKTKKEKGGNYITFLVACVKYLWKKNAKPFLLIHEGHKDLRVGQEVVKEAGKEITIIRETDALRIKGIIGASTGVISSRFHGLVSSLSQGVPAIATGWSHKYQMLLEDYAYPEGLVSVDSNPEKTRNLIDLITSESEVGKIKEKLVESSQVQKQASHKMWEEIFNTIAPAGIG